MDHTSLIRVPNFQTPKAQTQPSMTRNCLSSQNVALEKALTEHAMQRQTQGPMRQRWRHLGPPRRLEHRATVEHVLQQRPCLKHRWILLAWVYALGVWHSALSVVHGSLIPWCPRSSSPSCHVVHVALSFVLASNKQAALSLSSNFVKNKFSF